MTARTERPLAVAGGYGFALNRAGDTIAWVDQTGVYVAKIDGSNAIKVGDPGIDIKKQNLMTVQFTPDGKRIVIGSLYGLSGPNALFVVRAP